MKVKIHEGVNPSAAIKVSLAAHVAGINALPFEFTQDPQSEFGDGQKILLEDNGAKIFRSNSIAKYLLGLRKDSPKVDAVAQSKIDSLCEFEESATPDALAERASASIPAKSKVIQLDTVILWASLFALFLKADRLAYWKAKSPQLVEWYLTFGEQVAFRAAVGTYYIQILPHLKTAPSSTSVGSNPDFEKVTSETEAAVAYLKEKVNVLQGLQGGIAPGAGSPASQKELDQLKKDNAKLEFRIRHLLKNYKEDEDKANKEKKELEVLLRKAEFRIVHLKRSLEAEEARKA